MGDAMSDMTNTTTPDPYEWVYQRIAEIEAKPDPTRADRLLLGTYRGMRDRIETHRATFGNDT